MKKKGFTLIETIASISILMIIFSVCVSLCKFKNNLQGDMEATSYVYDIHSLLSYGKAICKEKNKYGRVTVSGKYNEIKFEEGWDNIEKKIILSNDMKFISNDISFYITNDGKIERGTTIIFLDKFNQKHFVVIRVGVDSISTREEGDT